LSYNHEVDTWQLIKDSIDTKQICVPVIQEDHRMDFVHIHNFHDLKKNKYGIYEPEYGQIIEKKDIDLIVVPLVGYSNDNYRLGYGGGYYDRYLENYKGQTIGLAFQLQKLDQYLPEDHDIALHKIITE
ncbi:MAG: 5-formyltetrahydrofolate cyclo-ligase, partial [Faecalibacillus sp.]